MVSNRVLYLWMSFSVCEIKNLLNASKIDGLIVGGEGGVWGWDFSYRVPYSLYNSSDSASLSRLCTH